MQRQTSKAGKYGLNLLILLTTYACVAYTIFFIDSSVEQERVSHRQSQKNLTTSKWENDNQGFGNRNPNADARSVLGARIEGRGDLIRPERDIQIFEQKEDQPKKVDRGPERSDLKHKGSSSKAQASGNLSKIHDAQHSVLMVVAHPDDEVLWGGEYLLKEGHNTHVVVTCTKNHHTSERREEFQIVQNRLGTHGEFLDGVDSPRSTTLEGHIRRRIQDLVCDRDWDMIITHGLEGEYGHPQHQLVHDAVVNATRKCCISAPGKLHVFEPHPAKHHNFSEAKNSVAKLYKSQARVIFESFGNWKEQIVPLKDYNYEAASQTCRENKGDSKFRQCRLHKMLLADPHHRDRLLPQPGIDCNKNEVQQKQFGAKESSYIQRLETSCGPDEAPVFVTFAISTGEDGRWSIKDGARAIRILYSSLVRSHGCAVQLKVHTNMPPKIARKAYILDGWRGYTTMGTKMEGVAFHEFNENYMNNPYNNKAICPHASKWFAISRAKLDTIEEYLMNGKPQHPVWIDLDTVVFDKVAVNAPVPWVYGYHNGTNRNYCYGDMFSLDMETVQDIRLLEKELLESNQTLPKYDLQGYFGILLTRQQNESAEKPLSSTSANNRTGRKSMLHVVQEESPDFSFGFDCSKQKHPKLEYWKGGVGVWKGESKSEGKRLMCTNLRHEEAMVASMSFTAMTYKPIFFETDDDTKFDIIADEEARNVMNNFFYNVSWPYITDGDEVRGQGTRQSAA